MADTQDYLSQLRSINEHHRGKLGHLAIGTHDLRAASIVHEYKPFNNPFNNISNKNQSISNISLGISPMHNITLSSVGVDGHGHSTTNHHQTIVELKQSYSPPSTPHSPSASEVQDTKVSLFITFSQKIYSHFGRNQ